MKREKKNIFSGGVVSEVFSNIYLFTKLLIINSGLKFLCKHKSYFRYIEVDRGQFYRDEGCT